MTTTHTSPTIAERREADTVAAVARISPARPSVMPRFWARNGWTVGHAGLAAVMVAIGITLTWDAFADIFHIASLDEESNHIFLVPIIAAWLVWARRERFRFCQPRMSMLGPAMVLFGWIVSSIGYSTTQSPFWFIQKATMLPLGAAIDWFVNLTTGKTLNLVDLLSSPMQAFWHAGAVLIVVGCLISVVGRDILLRFLPAFAVLVFLVPVPGFIRLKLALPLQGFLAQLTQFVFDLIAVDVQRVGNKLAINGVEVAIAEACNGLRMVFALVLVSYAFAFGNPLRNYVRFLILVAAPLTALFCNVLRMIPTVWLFGFQKSTVMGFDGDKVAHLFHDAAGWIMLVVAFLLLMSIIRVLRWSLIPVTPYTLAYD